jgi:uncharacterized membrane protein YagU involved in acid resistance
MTEFSWVSESWAAILLWGGLATVVMTSVLEGAQMAGLTRLSLPYLFGTAFTENRRRATLLGYVLYILGGWLFALVYAAILETWGCKWWIGPLAGAVHAAVLLTVFLRLLVEVHPRIAAPHQGPTARYRLERPGPFALHYGYMTPVTTAVAQIVFGLIFGLGYCV